MERSHYKLVDGVSIKALLFISLYCRFLIREEKIEIEFSELFTFEYVGMMFERCWEGVIRYWEMLNVVVIC